MELRETILEGTIQVFNQKGLKFTMDDIAALLKISKKTIYTVFQDKEALFLAMVDYIFGSIKESEQKAFEDKKLTTVEKIHKILGVLPEGYKDIDFRQLYLLKEKCTGCAACEIACTVGLAVQEISCAPECIRCGKCVEACPSKCLHMGRGR